MLNALPDALSAAQRFLADLIHVIGMALTFTGDLPQVVRAYPHPGFLASAVAVLAGASLLVGDSVILFVNRVRPARFVAALGLNGLLFALSLAVEGMTIWLVARHLFGAGQPLGSALLIVFLGSAPLVFGFLIMAATLGPYVGRLLRIWAWLIVVLAVRDGFGMALWEGLGCVILAQALIWLLNIGFRRPLAAMNNRLWRVVTHASLGMSAEARQKLRTGEAQREMVLLLSQALGEQVSDEVVI